MLDLWDRWVQFHELYIESEPIDAPTIDLATLAPYWVDRINAKHAVKMINNEMAAIRIIDVEYKRSDKVVVLLLQYADTNVTDPAFSDLKTGKLRVEPKLAGEGVAVSAHVAITLTPHDRLKKSYRFLLEEVPGLGRSTVSPFIRSELKEISKDLFEFKDADENNKTKKYLPAAEILGTPTQKLTEELEDGCILQGIELVQFTHSKPLIDEEGFYTEASRHIKLVPHKSGVSSIIDAVKQAWGLARREGFNNVKLRYKHPQGKQKTATMGSQIGDIEDALVVKCEAIRSDEVLAQCSEKIVRSVADKMVGLLR